MGKWKNTIKQNNLAVCKILVIKGDDYEILSEGSGCVINSKGYVVTAKHVLVEVMENRDVCKIIVCIKGQSPIEYNQPYFINEIEVTEKILFDIDVAIITPLKNKSSQTFTYANVNWEALEEGDDVLLCGYTSEEANLNQVFDTTKALDIKSLMGGSVVKHPSYNYLENMSKYLKSMQEPLLFKSGMISNNTKVTAGLVDTYEYNLYHIDNVCNRGMSGGPIFNTNGELVGIVIQRNSVEACISFELDVDGEKKNAIGTFYVPAGSSRTISIAAIKPIIDTILPL